MQTKLDKLIPKLVRAVEDLNKKVDSGFGQVDKRFEQVDKRFEQVDKRFEQVEVMIGNSFGEMQEQIYQLATKDDLARVASDVRDVKRRLIDLETDTPTKQEFEELRRRVLVG